MSAKISSEVEILSRVIKPNHSNLSAAAARGWLKLDFDQRDRDRMHELAVKAQEGTLTPREKVDLDNYRRVGHILDMVHSKARLSLKKHGLSA
jgi:hypothetical protein